MAPILSKCEKCCFRASVVQIYIFNLVDFCIGAAFITFAAYLFSQLKGNAWNGAVAWMCWSCIVIGVLTWGVALFSFCAVVDMDCRWAMRPSTVLSGVCALMNLIVGILGVALRQVFNSYLDDNGSDLGLSDRNIDTIHTFYVVILIFFFASVVLQTVRIWMSQGFVETSRLVDGEFESMLTKETEEWEENFAAKQERTQEKYRNLRQYYKDRFGKGNDQI